MSTSRVVSQFANRDRDGSREREGGVPLALVSVLILAVLAAIIICPASKATSTRRSWTAWRLMSAIVVSIGRRVSLGVSIERKSTINM